MDPVFTDPFTVAILVAVALVAGFVDAVAGGGGMLVIPALLSIGMPPHLVLGTNKLVSTCGTVISSATFWRRGLFNPRHWPYTAAASFAGALAGAMLVWQVDAGALRSALPVLIAALALYTVWPGRAMPAALQGHRPGRSAQVGAGWTIGFYDGFVGPGTGAFWTVAGLRLFRLDLVRAAGLARFMNLMSNVAALTAFAALGSVDYVAGLAMGSALMAGAWLGARSAIRFGAALIRPLFITVVLVMATRLIYLDLVGGGA